MSVWKTKLRRMLLTLGIVYGLLLIAGCAWQRKLLYFPTRLTPDGAKQLAAQEGFVSWQNLNGEIIGWKIPATGSPTGSVLIIHGNAGSALDRNYIARPIHEAAALDVFVMEYPGYGARGGSPGMKSWLAAGEEAIASLPTDKPIYVVSESIGAGVAAHLAKTHPTEVAGLVMFVPYDSLPSLAQSKMPLLLPCFFLVDRYKPAEWMKDYRGPVKIVLAGRDEIIPPKFGQRLFDSYAGPKSLQNFPDANHNEVTEQPPEWWREVFNFWQADRRKAGE
jgi:pimeloyl-ACP methyl ester carboxylesterase